MSDIYVQKNIAICNSLQRIAYDYVSSNDEDIEGVYITDSENEKVIQNVPIRNRSKRVHNSTSKKRSANGRKRMLGQQYLGFSTADAGFKQNSPKAERKIGPTCLSRICRNSKVRHCQNFDERTRTKNFESFWNKTWEAKREFVKMCVTKLIKKKTTVENSRKQNGFMFKLPQNEFALQVCRSMFLSTLSLRIAMVKGWINANDKPILASLVPKTNSQKGGCKIFLSKYLQNLDKMESHYCRKDTTKLYIATTFKTKADVFKDYLEKCAEKAVKPVSIFTFSTVFAEQNLALFMPRKDQCDTCVGFKAKQITIEEYDAHIMDKQRAQLEKQQDKLAAEEGRCHVFTMDAQAVKLCPDINASAIYYKTRLQVHNFTVYNLATHQCTNYWWNETDGDLSAPTFISCIMHHLSTHCLTDTLPIIIYSDGCGYQNRNHFLSNALSNFSIENNKIIEQKYLQKGHTQMKCDSAHAKIEAKLKNQTIYLPYDYVRVTKDDRKTVKIKNKIIKMPFDALHLKYDFFKNYKDTNLIRFSSIRPGRAKNDPTVSQLRSLLYSPSGTIKFKVNFDHNYNELPIRIEQYEGHIEPKQLYNGLLPIQQNKLKHLQELKAVIPEEYHYFYANLSHAQ